MRRVPIHIGITVEGTRTMDTSIAILQHRIDNQVVLRAFSMPACLHGVFRVLLKYLFQIEFLRCNSLAIIPS
jgi:hypothetical protein